MWICDIAELLRAYSKRIDWTGVVNRARTLGGARMLALGLLLAHDLSVPRCQWMCCNKYRANAN